MLLSRRPLHERKENDRNAAAQRENFNSLSFEARNSSTWRLTVYVRLGFSY